MSVKQTKITDELIDYLVSNFSAEDDLLAGLRKEAEALGIPDIGISPVEGRLLQVFLRIISAKRVLEIGTLAGYSAITMARALPDGAKLTTVESNPLHADFARKMMKEAKVDDIVEVVIADGDDYMDSLTGSGETFDFVFVDADKQSNYQYLTKSTPFIRKGGIFAADNAFAFGYLLEAEPERDPSSVRSVKKFNTVFNEHPDYLVSVVPVGDGLIIGVKL